MNEDTLDRLARRCGILPEYWQIDGTHRPCGRETVYALLTAMGLDVSSEAAATESLAQIEVRDAGRPFPAAILLDADKPAEYDLPFWSIKLEDGGRVECNPEAPDWIPPLTAGVHTLQADGHHAMLIASPPTAPSVCDIAGVAQAAGVWTSLYGQRSARNAGVGDYEDLARLAEILAGAGAAFVGINPVHALGAASADFSPYSPSSRTALNSGYIALDQVPEFAASQRARAAQCCQRTIGVGARRDPGRPGAARGDRGVYVAGTVRDLRDRRQRCAP